MKNINFCSDMAIEAVDNLNFRKKYGLDVKKVGNFITKSRLLIKTDKQAKELSKGKGLYITLDCSTRITNKDAQLELSREIRNVIKDMTATAIKRKPTILVVGLGNREMTTDALGSLVVDKLIVTRHLVENNKINRRVTNVAGIVPNVFGVTGIESFDIVKGVVDKISADLVIIVDTLASSKITRLFKSFQITNAGIEPGSALGQSRQRLDFDSLGVPVIAIGVPLALYARSILYDCFRHVEAKDCTLTKIAKYDIITKILGEDNISMILTPKDIDNAVEICADVIASGINLAYQNRSNKDNFYN